MNNERRKQIREIVKKVEGIQSDLNMVLDDEQYAYDSMPEGLQNSERGFNSEESIDLLGEAIDSIGDCIDSLNNIM